MNAHVKTSVYKTEITKVKYFSDVYSELCETSETKGFCRAIHRRHLEESWLGASTWISECKSEY